MKAVKIVLALLLVAAGCVMFAACKGADNGIAGLVERIGASGFVKESHLAENNRAKILKNIDKHLDELTIEGSDATELFLYRNAHYGVALGAFLAALGAAIAVCALCARKKCGARRWDWRSWRRCSRGCMRWRRRWATARC